MVLNRIIESYQNFSIYYKESLAYKVQKYGLIISSLLIASSPYNPIIPTISNYQLVIANFTFLLFITSLCIPPTLYCLYYYWKSVIIYDLKCWKLRDPEKQLFRYLSIRRYGDTIFKMSAEFPFGGSNWKITIEYPSGIKMTPLTEVSGTLVFHESPDSVSVSCSRADYLSFSLLFRISCDVDIALDKVLISFFCEKNSSDRKNVKKAIFLVDP